MKFSQQYPLSEDIGFPDGVRSARERWVAFARRELAKSRWASRATTVGLTCIFAFFGILPWMIQRVATPQQLAEHMARNMPMGNAHLGAEYYNIASAVVNGRGFSDPFVVESGPTAWMPPLLVWIQAGLISAFNGDRYYVMLSVVALKTLLLCVCGLAVIGEGWRRRSGWIAFGVFAAFIFADFHACFSFTHDGWLILAGVTATLFGLAWIDHRARDGSLTTGAAVAWGCLGGLAALSSPVAGFTWAVGTTLCLLLRSPKCLVLAAVTSMIVVVPWGIRNQRVFGRFVPVKSNVFFEFDQSLTLDKDGLLDYKTMSKHPYHEGPEQEAYIEMGEIAYLETKKERFLSRLQADPSDYFRKVRNRLIGTTLWPAGFSAFNSPFRWLLYPWPALSAIGLLLFCRPLTSLQRWTIVVYVVYLVPYILCSYYPRYGFPLLVVKMLLCYWAIDGLVALVQRVQTQNAQDSSALTQTSRAEMDITP